MNALSPSETDIPVHMVAGVILLANSYLDNVGLKHPSGSSVLNALGVASSSGYAQRDRLREALPGMVPRIGRPRREPEPERTETSHITTKVLNYLMANPGAASRTDLRTRYSTGFRHQVLDLAEEHKEISLTSFARAVSVPLSTLEDWLSGGRASIEDFKPSNMALLSDRKRSARIATVVEEWRRWKGDFLTFCAHINTELRIPYSRYLIRDLLHAEGVRIPRRKDRKRADAEALRGQLTTFFAGAQWVADGSPWTVQVCDLSYAFNLELVEDMATSALLGAAVSEQEDAAALIAAFEDAVETAGEAPLALLVDNRFSNHTDEVVEALGDTHKIRASVGRPETKAHVEGGGFGLFSQRMPELVVPSLDPEVVARVLFVAVFLTWARTLNHRPRKSQGNRSRAALYMSERPTEAERLAALEHLEELARKQEAAYLRRARTLDPVIRAHLVSAMDELGLEDLDGNYLARMAHFPADAVLTGLAVFRGKRAVGAIDEDADVRYLLGIIRNVAFEDEGWAITLALLDERLAARDELLEHLGRQRDHLELEADRFETLLKDYADRAVAADRRLDEAFWLKVATDLVLEEEDIAEQRVLAKLVARRIWTTHKAPKVRRERLTRRLFAMLFPV